jgi:uncharacterized phosphosugar-binding protein
MYSEYLQKICEYIQHMQNTQGEAIRKAAALVGDTILAKGLVYTFGSGHSQLLSQEVHARAGGMYPIFQIVDPLWGRAERIEGLGEVLLKGSGKKLYELGEVVLDTGTPAGDACMSFHGLAVKAGAASTVLGAALMNAVMVEAIQYILDKGGIPPVLMSANLDGNEEYNARVMAGYESWVNALFGLHLA